MQKRFEVAIKDNVQDIGMKLDKRNDLLNKLVEGQNNILDILKKIEKQL